MAEALILWRDDFPDERGDIVAVRPDGFSWGREECLGTFLVVRVPDSPELAAVLEPKDENGLGWYVLPDAVPAEEIAAAQTAEWHVIEIGLDAVEAR